METGGNSTEIESREMEKKPMDDRRAYYGFEFIRGIGRRMFLPSNLILLLCGLCWVACSMHFWRQIVFNFDALCDGPDKKILASYLAFLFVFSLPSLQGILVGEPSRRELPTAVNVVIFIVIFFPFLFAKQLATGKLQICSNNKDSFIYDSAHIKIVGFLSQGLFAGMRYWKGFHHVLVCLLVWVVGVSFNVEVQGQDSKFVILGLCVLIFAFSHLYFGVRRAEVDRAKEQGPLEKQQEEEQDPLEKV